VSQPWAHEQQLGPVELPAAGIRLHCGGLEMTHGQAEEIMAHVYEHDRTAWAEAVAAVWLPGYSVSRARKPRDRP
jgi:hypothetical protein